MKINEDINANYTPIYGCPVTTPKVIHDDSVVGIYQDKITGDVILGQPEPVTAIDQSFSMRGVVTQLSPEDDEIEAVVDPLIKKVRITGASVSAPDIPLGLTILPKGMFNRMRYEVWKYASEHLDKSDKTEFPFNEDTVYTVWTCKTLQNWKALISTSLPDGMYYECTFNGNTNELYLDAYKKFDNKVIKFNEESEKDKIIQENKVAATSSVKVRTLPRNE